MPMTKRAKDETVFALFTVLSFLIVGAIIVPGVLFAPRAAVEAANVTDSR